MENSVETLEAFLVGESFRIVFVEIIDTLPAMGALRGLGKQKGKFIYPDKMEDAMRATLVVLELLVEAMKPHENANEEEIEESNQAMKEAIESVKANFSL